MTGMKSHFAVISNSSKQAPSQAFSIVRQRGCYVTGPTPDERDRASAGGPSVLLRDGMGERSVPR